MEVLGYILLLLWVGFSCGGSIAAFASPKPLITDAQYREIRANMRRMS